MGPPRFLASFLHRKPLGGIRSFHVSLSRKLPSYTKPLYAVAAPAVGSYKPEEGEHVLSSPSELARKISAKVLPKLPRPDVRKVVEIGRAHV